MLSTHRSDESNADESTSESSLSTTCLCTSTQVVPEFSGIRRSARIRDVNTKTRYRQCSTGKPESLAFYKKHYGYQRLRESSDSLHTKQPVSTGIGEVTTKIRTQSRQLTMPVHAVMVSSPDRVDSLTRTNSMSPSILRSRLVSRPTASPTKSIHLDQIGSPARARPKLNFVDYQPNQAETVSARYNLADAILNDYSKAIPTKSQESSRPLPDLRYMSGFDELLRQPLRSASLPRHRHTNCVMNVSDVYNANVPTSSNIRTNPHLSSGTPRSVSRSRKPNAYKLNRNANRKGTPAVRFLPRTESESDSNVRRNSRFTKGIPMNTDSTKVAQRQSRLTAQTTRTFPSTSSEDATAGTLTLIRVLRLTWIRCIRGIYLRGCYLVFVLEYNMPLKLLHRVTPQLSNLLRFWMILKDR